MDLLKNLPTYRLKHTLNTPAPISAMTFGNSQLVAGSDDGSLRVYELSSLKVCKAIRGLPTEISSVCCFKRPGSHLRDVWLACGRQAYSFQMDLEKLVLTAADASSVIELCNDEEDVLNELALNSGKTHLAFSTDSGVVGVVDLSTKTITKMKTGHSSICGIVRFIPDRPREIVSGGYDSCLLHFDFLQGTVLSRRDIPPFPASDGMALTPPFIMSAAMTTTGIMAAGTADGRLWLGLGGEKGGPIKSKKRSRKWDGCNPDEEHLEKIAEGPIVAMAFSDLSTLTVSTLLGSIKQYRIVRAENEELHLAKIWEGQSRVSKVNALIIDEGRFVVAGLTDTAKGVIEIWNMESPS